MERPLPAAAPTTQVRVAEQMEAIIAKRIATDQLVLPAMPPVAAKCMLLLKNPDFSMREAGALIETDPTLAAKLLRLASSVAYGGRDPVKDLTQAIARLGTAGLRSFLTEASARKVFVSTDKRVAEASLALWKHSLAVAVIARELTVIRNRGDADVAYMAGLLHDIGKPVVALMLLDAERALAERIGPDKWLSGDEWIDVVQRCHRPVGIALAAKWELPEPIQGAIRGSVGGYDEREPSSSANLVRLANALVKQQGVYVGNVEKNANDEMAANGRRLLGVDDALVASLIATLAKLPD